MFTLHHEISCKIIKNFPIRLNDTYTVIPVHIFDDISSHITELCVVTHFILYSHNLGFFKKLPMSCILTENNIQHHLRINKH